MEGKNLTQTLQLMIKNSLKIDMPKGIQKYKAMNLLVEDSKSKVKNAQYSHDGSAMNGIGYAESCL